MVFYFLFYYSVLIFFVETHFFKVCNFLPNGSFLFKYRKIPDILSDDEKLVLLIFIVYYTTQSFFYFIEKGDYKNISMEKLTFETYIRIF